jgi:DNA (cytosine-5)-methyltransferase 1
MKRMTTSKGGKPNPTHPGSQGKCETADFVSPATRSRIMRSVGRTDTAPEMAVRAKLRQLGIRGRYNVRNLPGSPDIASKKGGWAIFVHGCFWHGHADCKKTKGGKDGRVPIARRTYWAKKLEENKTRDTSKRRELKCAGFRVLTLWECQVSNERQLDRALRRFFANELTTPPRYGLSSVISNSSSLRVVGLFAGIGGLELGLARAGHEGILLCEIEEGAKAVLEARFPGVPVASDVTTMKTLPKGTDLVTAGFPCQDLSQAGATRGIGGNQSSLVDHVFRLIQHSDVPWLLLENVPFMLQLGGGAAIRHVTSRLGELGFRWAYRVINTLAFGIPQRRERVFLLASREHDPAPILFGEDSAPPPLQDWRGKACGFYWTEGRRGLGWAVDAVPTLKGGSTLGIPSPPAIWLPDGSFVTPDIQDAERLQGFPAGWTSPAANRVRASNRWKLVGNAVTVDVAEWIGRKLSGSPLEWNAPIVQFETSVAWPKAAFWDGKQVLGVQVSAWPARRTSPPLVDFLQYAPRPLSDRALAGFHSRLNKSNLRRPVEFDRDLCRALAMSSPIGQTTMAFTAEG